MASEKPVIDIDINEIFYKLHEVALEQAKKVSPDIDIQNLGVDDKAKNYEGAGEFLIVTRAKDEQKNIPDKSKFVDVIKKYVEFFVGKEIADKVQDNDCQPIEVQIQKESLVDARRPMVESLFLKEDKTELLTVGYALPYVTEIEGQKAKDPSHWLKKKVDQAGFLLKGIYQIGLKPLAEFWPALKALTKGALSGIWSDLTNIKLKTGSGDIDIGGKVKAAADAAKDIAAGTSKAAGGAIAAGARAFYNKATTNFGRKDLAVVRDDFDKQFDKDFPNNRVLIKLYKTTVLLNQLRQQKSLTSEIQQNLRTKDYCIGVIVKSNDINYLEYSKESIAKVFSKAFGHYSNIVFKGGISADQVIKVEGFNSNFKNKRDREFQRGIGDSIEPKSIMDILFEGKLVLESAMSEARAKLVDFLATLSTEDKNYALDFFFGDPALNSSDIKSRSYKDKDELINKIFKKDLSTMRTAINTYHPIKGVEAVEKILKSMKNSQTEKNLAALLAKLTPETAKAAFRQFNTAESIKDEDVQSIKTLTTGTKPKSVRKIAGKHDLVALFAQLVDKHGGNTSDLQKALHAEYKPESLNAYDKIYDVLNNAYKASTSSKTSDYTEDLYLIDRNIEYDRVEDETKGKK